MTPVVDSGPPVLLPPARPSHSCIYAYCHFPSRCLGRTGIYFLLMLLLLLLLLHIYRFLENAEDRPAPSLCRHHRKIAGCRAADDCGLAHGPGELFGELGWQHVAPERGRPKTQSSSFCTQPVSRPARSPDSTFRSRSSTPYAWAYCALYVQTGHGFGGPTLPLLSFLSEGATATTRVAAASIRPVSSLFVSRWSRA